MVLCSLLNYLLQSNSSVLKKLYNGGEKRREKEKKTSEFKTCSVSFDLGLDYLTPALAYLRFKMPEFASSDFSCGALASCHRSLNWLTRSFPLTTKGTASLTYIPP